MRRQRRAVWATVENTLWFIPMLGILGGLVLAVATVAVDRLGISASWRELYWLLGVQADSARQVLGTIAGSMITVISLVGSLTLLAMTLAASQLGPRLLQLFAADRLTQLVFGQFLGTFVYAIVVLRAVSAQKDDTFVPQLSVLVALLLVLASLMLLIVFIHHLATFMQADSVLAALSTRLMRSIRSVFPPASTAGAEPAHPAAASPLDGASTHTIAAPRTGYVQRVDVPALIAHARRHAGGIALLCAPGDFVVAGTPLARFHRSDPAANTVRGRNAAGENVDAAVAGGVHSAVVMGAKRTAVQDVPFAANSVVEIALRALSPSVNDYRTPCAALDLLGAALIEVLHRGDPPARRHDASGVARVRMAPPTFATLAEIAFADIRSCATGRPAVLHCLSETLGRVAGHAAGRHERRVLLVHARAVALAARRSVTEPTARRELAASLRAVNRTLIAR